jgi:hypothetical protein
VSVDTYLKGKDTSTYRRVAQDGIDVLVAPAMARWSERVDLTTKRGVLGRGLTVDVTHEHGPACRH